MQTIILATNNSGKLSEFNQLLAGVFTLIPQGSHNIEAVAETGLSFIENALIKARHASKHSALPAIADDSGLAVDALNGAPGIRSARYAGNNASDQHNIDKLLADMENIADDNRTAAFCCAIAFVRHANDPLPIIATAQWHGEILRKARGDNGFGYDPIFYLPTQHCTAAQLDNAEKNQLSHRAQALSAFFTQYQNGVLI